MKSLPLPKALDRVCVANNKRKKCKIPSFSFFQAGDAGEEKKRFSWDGSLLHDINISASATKWEKVAY